MSNLHVQKIKGFQHIYAADDFFKDFNAICGKSAAEALDMKDWLYGWLDRIDSEPHVRLLRVGAIECLHDCTPKLFSLRHAHSIHNERYLFCFFDGDDIVLLTAFSEKSKSDYDSAIRRAQSIRGEIDEI